MKLLIASDLHGAAPAVRALVDRIEAEAPDRIVLLGDLLYHGPRNDLPEGYAPKEAIALLNGLAGRIVAVRGNCDAEVDQMVLDFPCMADYALVEADGHVLLVRPYPCEDARRARQHAVRQPGKHLHPEGRLRQLRRVRTRRVHPEGLGWEHAARRRMGVTRTALDP